MKIEFDQRLASKGPKALSTVKFVFVWASDIATEYAIEAAATAIELETGYKYSPLRIFGVNFIDLAKEAAKKAGKAITKKAIEAIFNIVTKKFGKTVILKKEACSTFNVKVHLVGDKKNITEVLITD